MELLRNQAVIFNLLHAQMKNEPTATAVFDEDRRLTTIELEQLIETICAKIPTTAHIIGIMMDHTVEMIAAIFAVLKRGCAYVPVEPFFPQRRIDFMMPDAGVDMNMILTNSE